MIENFIRQNLDFWLTQKPNNNISKLLSNDFQTIFHGIYLVFNNICKTLIFTSLPQNFNEISAQILGCRLVFHICSLNQSRQTVNRRRSNIAVGSVIAERNYYRQSRLNVLDHMFRHLVNYHRQHVYRYLSFY